MWRRWAGGARGAEPDGVAGGRGGRGGRRGRGGGRRGGRGRGALAPVHGHGVPHDALHAVPAAVQDAQRVVPLRLRQQRDRWYGIEHFYICLTIVDLTTTVKTVCRSVAIELFPSLEREGSGGAPGSGAGSTGSTERAASAERSRAAGDKHVREVSAHGPRRLAARVTGPTALQAKQCWGQNQIFIFLVSLLHLK